MQDKMFDELIKSVKEAGNIRRGEKASSRIFEYSAENIKTIRTNAGLSQNQFARLMLISVATLQNWEQGRRRPNGPALALLTIFKNNPKAAISALHQHE